MQKSTFFTTEIAKFHELDLVTFKSNALKQRADVSFYIPDVEEPMPMVILLHGVYGSHWAWTAKGHAHKTVQRLLNQNKIKPMALVMPSDGLFGDGSGYLKHNHQDFEKYIVEEISILAKENFSKIDTDKIFITGLSMGGFGALRLGAKYPEKFKAFGGMSSITEINQMKNFIEDYDSLTQCLIECNSVLDQMLLNKNILPPFIFDCGTDDILLEDNRALNAALNNSGISHTYEESDGNHSWEYWTKRLEHHLIYFNQFIL